MEKEKRYAVLYADPPWRYEQKNLSGSAEKHYPTMSMDELCRLDVESIAEKDAVLFMWVTFPQLAEAFRLIKAWDSGQGAMPKSACLQQGENPKGSPPKCASLS